MFVGQFTVDLHEEDVATAVECSVIWQTTGKGEADLGVHFFERYKQHTDRRTLRQPHRFSTVLPYSPLSYEGQILQVRWLVRVRVFFETGGQYTEDLRFRLGGVGSGWTSNDAGMDP